MTIRDVQNSNEFTIISIKESHMLSNILDIFNGFKNITINNFNFNKFLDQFTKYFDLFLGSIIIILLGYFAAKFLKNLIKRIGKRSNINVLFINFVGNFVYYTTFVVFFVSALNNLGIQTTSIATVLGALSVGIGLAFQSSLSNFAAGLLILILRPFKINDLIEVANVAGSVTSINTLIVTIKTRDNKVIIIPNSKIISETIINHSTESKRRIKFFIQVSDMFNVIKSIEILEELAKNENGFLQKEEILVYLTEAFEKDKESGICVEAWIQTTDLTKINSNFKQKIINQFNQEKIKISFPRSNILI